MESPEPGLRERDGRPQFRDVHDPTPVLPATSGSLVKVTVDTPKVAVTARAAVIVTVQLPAPTQLPPQPTKVEPEAGAAVKVTTVLMVNDAEHVAPHAMPAGVLVTVPLPAPALVTVRAKVGTVKLAATVVAAFIVTTQVPVPVQPPPLQPVKVEPVAGEAVRVTWVPKLNEVEQVAPHVMPAGALPTVPVPVPDLFTVRAKDWTTKPAVTVVAALIVTTQAPVPVQPPPVQPVNVEPARGRGGQGDLGAAHVRSRATRAAGDAGRTARDGAAARAGLGNCQRRTDRQAGTSHQPRRRVAVGREVDVHALRRCVRRGEAHGHRSGSRHWR